MLAKIKNFNHSSFIIKIEICDNIVFIWAIRLTVVGKIICNLDYVNIRYYNRLNLLFNVIFGHLSRLVLVIKVI